MLTPIPPDRAARLQHGGALLVDVREPAEIARAAIPGAASLPLSRLDATPLGAVPGQTVVFLCRSGARTSMQAARLAAKAAGHEAFVLQGGLAAWQRAGLPVQQAARAPLPLSAQVMITAGLAVLAGTALAAGVSPWFLALPAAMGAGLLLAGLTGHCPMARILRTAPWNRDAGSRPA
jgi:rhodanese-related sulfurtransferase